MRFYGAVIKEQEVIFAIVVVKPTVLNSSTTRESDRNSFSTVIPGMPIILMSQNGRTDIVNFLVKVNPRRIPWKTYTINE